LLISRRIRGIETSTKQSIEIFVHIVFNGNTRINVGADIMSFISYSLSFYLSCITVMIHIPFLYKSEKRFGWSPFRYSIGHPRAEPIISCLHWLNVSKFVLGSLAHYTDSTCGPSSTISISTRPGRLVKAGRPSQYASKLKTDINSPALAGKAG
jgi:hypothetical protein